LRLELFNNTAFRLSVGYTLLVTLAVGVTLGRHWRVSAMHPRAISAPSRNLVSEIRLVLTGHLGRARS